MGNAANLNMNGFACGNHGNMLFCGAIGFACTEQLHCLAAARERGALVEQLDGNVSAMSALEEFEFHDISPFIRDAARWASGDGLCFAVFIMLLFQ